MTATAAPQRYYHPSQFRTSSFDKFAQSIQPHRTLRNPCAKGLKFDGARCTKSTKVSKNIYLYNAPDIPVAKGPFKGELPLPKVHYNFVFIKTPEIGKGLKPVVVPPPKQKTLVYVLSERPPHLDQEVIEVPTEPTKPEVFFISYKDGDNPTLPGGIDLQTALSQSATAGGYVPSDFRSLGSAVGIGDDKGFSTLNDVSFSKSSDFSSQVFDQGGKFTNYVPGY